MIFITLGTTNFQLDRLIKTIDSIMTKNKSSEKLIIQNKNQKYKTKYQNTITYHQITYQKLIHCFSKARIIITHAGASSIFQALKYGKNIPMVIPRYKKYSEHINNHQVNFAKSLFQQKYPIKIIFDNPNLKKLIQQHMQNPTKIKQKKKFQLLCSNTLINNLNNYCQKINQPLA
ncbi:hypothetical protein KKE45_02385 [Patescibacteria group bacterium]|nr:hypothetical protein [Patescibacteria group bacterium]